MDNLSIPKSPSRAWLIFGWLLVGVIGIVYVLGCAPTSAQPRGWSGAVISGGSAVVVTMEGKLAVIDIASRSRARADIPITAPVRPGGFGCSSPVETVAVYGTPAVSGNVAYVGGYDGRLHAIGLGSNESESWQYPAQGSLQPIAGGVAISPGVVYFGSSDGGLYAVNIVGHDLKWKFATGDKIWSTPVVDGNTIYIGSFDKKLYAVNISSGTRKWEFATDGPITGTPLVHDNTVYIGSFDRYVYAVDAATGTLKWKSATRADKWFWTAPVTVGGRIYVGSLDGKVYAFSNADGSQVAVLDFKSPVASAPVVVDDSVIAVSQDGKVFSINSRTNEMRSLISVEETFAPLLANQGVVYIHSQVKETLYAVNAQTGVKLWSLLMGSQ